MDGIAAPCLEDFQEDINKPQQSRLLVLCRCVMSERYCFWPGWETCWTLYSRATDLQFCSAIAGWEKLNTSTGAVILLNVLLQSLLCSTCIVNAWGCPAGIVYLFHCRIPLYISTALLFLLVAICWRTGPAMVENKLIRYAMLPLLATFIGVAQLSGALAPHSNAAFENPVLFLVSAAVQALIINMLICLLPLQPLPEPATKVLPQLLNGLIMSIRHVDCAFPSLHYVQSPVSTRCLNSPLGYTGLTDITFVRHLIEEVLLIPSCTIVACNCSNRFPS